jgi:hypothetical protein
MDPKVAFRSVVSLPCLQAAWSNVSAAAAGAVAGDSNC